uniref:Uncharacterized protein n=1 Tax=Rhizophora mucronata TaxID=61149 RepID=A0A2P2MLJ7_RHIMU
MIRSPDCDSFSIELFQYNASLELSKLGFLTVPSFLVQGSEGDESALSEWFESNQLDAQSGKVVVRENSSTSMANKQCSFVR